MAPIAAVADRGREIGSSSSPWILAAISSSIRRIAGVDVVAGMLERDRDVPASRHESRAQLRVRTNTIRPDPNNRSRWGRCRRP